MPSERLAKRIIACLDVDAGRVVKGIQFQQLRDAGDPAELARTHAQAGADEIVLLDITATSEGRMTLVETVRRTKGRKREVGVPWGEEPLRIAGSTWAKMEKKPVRLGAGTSVSCPYRQTKMEQEWPTLSKTKG